MPAEWTERQQQVYNEIVDRLKFWGYNVPAGEKLIDPALLLMLKTFAYHTTEMEDKLKDSGETVINELISEFFMTGLKRPVPAYTMLSCTCADDSGLIDTDNEFICRLHGIEIKEYSFYPLYPQEIYKFDADIVLYHKDEILKTLRASSKEAIDFQDALNDTEEGQQRLPANLQGGTIYIGITADIPLDQIPAIQLYCGADLEIAKMLNWIDWSLASGDNNQTFKPGKYHNKLEIYKHLDIRELEINSDFQSRLYSSDFLTSGQLHWHFKHYLAAAKSFVNIPVEIISKANKINLPEKLITEVEELEIDAPGIPRIWLEVKLEPDFKITDLKKFSYLNSNTFPVININRQTRNKYTMSQPAVEVNLFEYPDDNESSELDRLFSIDRVRDSDDYEYYNFRDLSSYGNPHKYMVLDESSDIKIKVDFSELDRDPPDYVVVEYSMTAGSGGDGIGADIEFELGESNPQIGLIRNLISSQGGSDAKSMDEVKRMTGFFLRNHGVAMSNGEIEFLAKNFDNRIASAKAEKCVSRTSGGLLPAVNVDIKLSAEIKINPDEKYYLQQRLSEYLDSYTPVNLHLQARIM